MKYQKPYSVYLRRAIGALGACDVSGSLLETLRQSVLMSSAPFVGLN